MKRGHRIGGRLGRLARLDQADLVAGPGEVRRYRAATRAGSDHYVVEIRMCRTAHDRSSTYIVLRYSMRARLSASGRSVPK